MRMRFAGLWLLVATAGAWAGQPAAPPYEIVKDAIEIEVAPDGSEVSSREVVYHVLDARGIEMLHEQRIGTAQSYEDVRITAAYTLKANGQHIPVPPNGYLTGYGQTSQPGFQDNRMVSIFFPNLEVGDSVVLLTTHRQITPWFAGRFDYRADFSRLVPARDVVLAVTAPTAMPLKFDVAGLEATPARSAGSKTRWVWSYHNETPVPLENDSVSEADFGPHLVVTSFADYAEVAHAYGDRSKPATELKPEITALADQLTAGVSDRRAQTKILYDWVSSHIAYVQIVLGAGGFTPHDAKDVLTNRYGDCKDHVALLEALLKAKGIVSTGVLIRIGERTFTLSPAATPHAFDHVITYVPEFDLYLDSTAQIAPFGVLPYADAGKPVLNVATGAVARTPPATAVNSTMKSVADVTLQKDGSADGRVTITTTGALAVEVRGAMRGLKPGDEAKFLSGRVGPGAEGKLEFGDPAKLSDPYVLKANYHVPGAITVPGPGTLPPSLAFRLLSFSQLVAEDLPATRGSDYICGSLSAAQEIHYAFPEGYRMLSIPDSQVLTADGVRLQIDYDRSDPRSLNFKVALRLIHPEASCTPAYYNKTRASLAKMLNALKEEVIYRGPKESSK